MFCFHDRLREFTFSDGALIKMCPDCTAFDTKRNEVLRSGSVAMPHAEDQIHWRELLDEAELPMSAGIDKVDRIVYAGDSSAADKLDQLRKLRERGFVNLSPEMLAIFGINGACMLLRDLLQMRSSRSSAKPTTLDDHEWVARQRPFPHTYEMPRRFTSYCAQCTEVVLSVKRPWVVRITKGVYLPIEHECNSVRVYNLQGNLIEVKAQ